MSFFTRSGRLDIVVRVEGNASYRRNIYTDRKLQQHAVLGEAERVQKRPEKSEGPKCVRMWNIQPASASANGEIAIK